MNENGVNVEGAVNAIAAVNVDERGSSDTGVSSRQRIVQRGRRAHSDARNRKKGGSTR
jgi:hypothetical protein